MDEKDYGTEYLKSLGLRPVKTGRAFYGRLEKHISKDFADEFRRLTAARFTDDDPDQKARALYELKNQDLDTSLYVSGLSAGNYYREACAWIMENKEYFHGRVLDLGCDNGLLTCFIAKQFPDCQVTGIDRVSKSIDVAKSLADRLSLSNVTFEAADLDDYKPEEKFDLVFSSLTVVENMQYTVEEPEFYGFTSPIRDVIGEFFVSVLPYAEKLGPLVKDGGHILQMERMGLNQVLAAWQLALSRQGFTELQQKVVITDEIDRKGYFTGFICSKEKSDMTDLQILEKWYAEVLDHSVVEAHRLFGLAAQTAIEYFPYEQEKGVIVYDPKDRDGMNQSISCGWLDMPDGKRYVEYNVGFTEDGFRERVLFFADDVPREDILKDVENWQKYGEKNKLVFDQHYFGDEAINPVK
ncbi:MAG: class I SAM-dependent methyltransferase [Eubacteriales bacterium]|nr:class I SAM-dependent methyltransferase [Eubacteriales bacterium]